MFSCLVAFLSDNEIAFFSLPAPTTSKGKEHLTPVHKAFPRWMPFLRNVTKIIYIVNSCAKLPIIRITILHNSQEV
jgi:hypothetical protein